MLFKVRESLYSRGKKSVLNTVLNVIICLLVLILLIEIYFGQTYTGIYVIGDSMLPTVVGAPEPDRDADGNVIKQYAGGDYVFVNKFSSPDYSDVVVVQTTETVNGKIHTKNIIKRVVALGGDTVWMENGRLYLIKKGDDEIIEVEENYVLSDNNTPENSKNTFEEHVVGDGCMFLLGDNRDYSSDSRANGDYSIDSLIGVVPDWSLNLKSMITAIYSFFTFTL